MLPAVYPCKIDQNLPSYYSVVTFVRYIKPFPSIFIKIDLKQISLNFAGFTKCLLITYWYLKAFYIWEDNSIQ